MRALALIVFAYLIARADTIELKTGEKIEGAFKQAGPAGAVIEVGGQPLTFALDKVRAIYLGATPLAQQGPSVFVEALDALRALQSVTNSGVSYRDYAPRVLDAKVKMDRYLASPTNGDDKARAAAQLAMRYYEVAAEAWNNKISKSGRDREVGLVLRSDPGLRECPAVQGVVAEADAGSERFHTQPVIIGKTRIAPPQPRPGQSLASMIEDFAVYSTGSRVGESPNILWSCATAKLAEADRK